MNRFSSSITFLYYQNLEYGKYIMESCLELQTVMDQGFAKVYAVNDGCFVGIVQSKPDESNNGNTLFSLNTQNLKEEHSRLQTCDLTNITSIRRIDTIPLDSFFFDDHEGHKFEVQQFVRESDQQRF